MESEHRIALDAYHNSLLKEARDMWSEEDLMDLLNFKNSTKHVYSKNDIDNYIRYIIKTDSSAYDCLTCPLEDMPLFINDREHSTVEISEWRLRHGK